LQPVVGRVKTCTYDLPKGHTYGASVVRDPEGAGAVISTWDVAERSVAKKSDRNLIKTNVLAIQAGNLSAKDMREFAQCHPDIRFKPPVSKLRNEDGTKYVEKIPSQGPFGIKNPMNEASLSNLIEAKYTHFVADESDYPDVRILKKRFKIPPHRMTKAAMGHSIRNRPPEPEKPKFVLSKFQNVPGRLQLAH
ncbi:unnamed protein product, partial [Chrysoparadoxa australica]